MGGNKSLNAAAAAKQDEFYTQLTDIEKELRHYRAHFKGKTVLCNCDDPFESNFFKYFVLNFNRLGLKKLIATCYAGSPIANQQLSISDILGGTGNIPRAKDDENQPYVAIVTTVYDKTGDGGIDMFDVAELFRSGENTLARLEGDGDFRSPECLALMDEADIVVTNPPFSLFREYVASLVERDKKFVIIGPKSAIHYKEIFPLIRDNKIWTGHRDFAGGMWFYSDYDGKIKKIQDDKKLLNVPSIWFTNLDIKKRHEEMILVKRYVPEDYPRYYNYAGIDVSKVSDIPCDYFDEMGVPDTFLNQYNPEQFEIIGVGTDVPKTKEHKSIDGKEIVYIENGVVVWSTPYTIAERKIGNSLRLEKNGQPGRTPYSRIIIRRKGKQL